jgi:adenylate kinase
VRILILGPQGSGKGTQAAVMAAAYGVPHVATGDILRAAIAEGSDLGRRVQPITERGDLVPDDLMIELIRERLVEEDGFVLDGFPRKLRPSTRCSTRSQSRSTSFSCSRSATRSRSRGC